MTPHPARWAPRPHGAPFHSLIPGVIVEPERVLLTLGAGLPPIAVQHLIDCTDKWELILAYCHHPLALHAMTHASITPALRAAARDVTRSQHILADA